MSTIIKTILTLAIGTLSIAVASAQERLLDDGSQPFDPAEEVQLKINFTLDAWLPRLRANTSLDIGVTSGTLYSFEDDLGFDQRDLGGHAELHLQRDRLNVWISGFTFSDDGEAVATDVGTFGPISVTAGDTFETDIDYHSAALEVGYDLFRVESEREHSRGRDFILAGLFGGVRYVDIDHSFDVTNVLGTASTSADARGFAGFVGFRTGGRFLEQFSFDGKLGIGATLDGGGHYISVQAAIRWQPLDNVGITAGYRLLDLKIEDGDYTFDGRLAGVFIGGVINF